MQSAPQPTERVPMLVSYHYMRKWDDAKIDYTLSNPHIELLLDSGAFSALNAGAEVHLDDYMDFVRRWEDKLFGYMLLDKLGDPEQTRINYRTMLDAGLHPIPIHVRGDNQERMDELFETSAYVAMGGFRRPKRGWCSPGYIRLKMDWAAGRPVHWLGYTRLDILKAFSPYSCDSSNIMSAAMFGLMLVYNDGGLQQYKFPDIMRMQQPTPAIARALHAVGGTWSDLKDRRSWKSSRKRGQRSIEQLSHAITCWSHVVYSRHVQRALGTRVFLAVTEAQGADLMIAHYANQTNIVEGREPYHVPDHIADPPRTIQEWYTE